MVIMEQPILSILLFSVILGAIVFVFNLLIPALTGRHREAMSIVDLALLIVFIAIVIFVLRFVGFWPTLVAGI